MTRADVRDRKTTVDFSGPVEIPGKVLPAGRYVFKLADSQSSLNIVRIMNDREDHVYATILAIPNSRTEPTDQTVMTFYEGLNGRPEALRAWFYPGDTYGQEFAYPRTRAIEIAEVTHQRVPTAPDTPITQPQQDQSVSQPIVSEPPVSPEIADQTENPQSNPQLLAQAQPPNTSAPSAASGGASDIKTDTTNDKKLPDTASQAPLLALVGILSIVAAAGIHRLAKRLS